MTIKLNKITGFVSSSPVVCLLRKGLPFYANTLKEGMDLIRFNVPAGEYELIAGRITKTITPFVYEKIKMPDSNNIITLPERVKISYIDNPNKCSVNLSNKRCLEIYFDHAFKGMPHFVIVWVVGHELYHTIYRGKGQNSEKCCDHGSANAMLKCGYNPKQIDAAIDMAISNGYHAVKRKDELYENLTKIKIKK